LEEILKKKIEYSSRNKEVRQFDISEILVRDKLQQSSKEESPTMEGGKKISREKSNKEEKK
jgi:hypothetical protein